MAFQYWNWEEIDINWDTLNLNWEEVGFLISEVLPVAGVSPYMGVTGKRKYDLKKLNELPEEKKRQIIKIVCKIKGEDEEYINYKYKNDKDIKITAEHIDIIVNEILKNKIKVNVQNIS
jgi:hypothetical protein